MTTTELTVSDEQVQEEYYRRGWTDGFPVVPATRPRVDAFLTAASLSPADIVGDIPARSRELTAEKAAINAVMAGCRPEYAPIVITALGAMLDPLFNPQAVLTSTGGAALCLVVSGPLVEELDLASGLNALGSANRANVTIGRALRLVARNVFGARTGVMDGSSLGHPGKYSLVVAEAEPPDPLAPLRVDLGHGVDDTTITLLATEGPRQIANHLNPDPEGILLTIASAIAAPATFSVGKGGQGLVVLGYEHRQALATAGWTRRRIQEFLVEASRVTPAQLEAAGVLIEHGAQHDMTPAADGRLPSIASPDDLFVVTAGGAGAGWSAYLPVWAPLLHSRAVSRVVPRGK